MSAGAGHAGTTGGPVVEGWFRDRARRRPARAEPWRHNLICFSGLELLGRLLCGEDLNGLTWCAFGAGDPTWDQQPPPADRNRDRLTNEVARVALGPGAVRYISRDRAVRVDVTLPAGEGAGPLREFGLFGGDASARPGSGLLMNHRAHPVVDHGDEPLEREIRLVFADALAPGARDLFAQLLSGGGGALASVGVGTSAAQTGAARNALGAEVARVGVDRRRLGYDRRTHAVEAVGTIAAEHRHQGLKEAGLFGGDAARSGGGLLVDRVLLEDVSTTSRVPLEQRFVLRLGGTGQRTVPDVVGRSRDEASELLGVADLAVGAIVERELVDRVAGEVVEQQPAAGALAAEAGAVDLVVSRQPRVVVPAVVGAPIEQARAALDALGLTVDDAPVERPDLTVGVVVTATPPVGATVERGSRVALTVAGVARRALPDVRGRPLEVAAVLLRGAGFEVVDATATAESSSPAGTVVDQAPPAGEVAAVDTTVGLTLAAPFTVVVPDLTGIAEQDIATALAGAAASVLVDLGLPIEPPGLAQGARSAVPVARPEDPVGIAVEQRPAAASRVALYTTVDVGIAAAVDRRVPDVVGRTQAAARSELVAAGFGVGAVESRASDAPSGTVVAQTPVAGATWPAGARITLVVAVASRVAVPRVLGLAVDAGREAIISRGLSVGTVTTQVGEDRPGMITAQAPSPETLVRAGADVALTIAAGVPDVIGATRDEAVAAIEAAGLVADEVPAESSVAPGTVTAQDPAADAAAAPGDHVTITVAVPVRVEVPDVTGQAFARAETTLDRAGLRAELVGRREDDTQPAGSVLSQDPAAGERLPVGAVVALTIAVAASRRAVPDLTGLTPDRAKRVCADAGFGFEVRSERPVAGATAGTVVEQAPAAGTEAVIGDTVTVVLASADTSLVVPDLRGVVLERATSIAREAGLALVVSDRVAGDDADVVVDQDPAPTSRVPMGTTIRVVITTAVAAMPNVIGMEASVAATGLQRMGLVVSITQRFVLGRQSGIVLAQDPLAGARIRSGVTATLVVSTARRPFPDHGGIFEPDEGPVIVRPPRPTGPIGPIDPIGPVIDPGRFVIGDRVTGDRVTDVGGLLGSIGATGGGIRAVDPLGAVDPNAPPED